VLIFLIINLVLLLLLKDVLASRRAAPAVLPQLLDCCLGCECALLSLEPAPSEFVAQEERPTSLRLYLAGLPPFKA
jgi:hypothetical protein